jgi:hypothetical protein
VNGIFGFSAFILAGKFSPADQPCPVQVGMIGRLRPRPGGIVWTRPAFPVIMEIAEYVKILPPTGRTGVKIPAACQIQARNDKVKFMVPGVSVPHPENIPLIRLQSGKSHRFEIVHNPRLLRWRNAVIRMP